MSGTPEDEVNMYSLHPHWASSRGIPGKITVHNLLSFLSITGMNKVVPLFLIEILVLSVLWTGLTTYILPFSLILFGLALSSFYYNGRATCRHSGFTPRTAWPAHLHHRFRRRRRTHSLRTYSLQFEVQGVHFLVVAMICIILTRCRH